MEEENEKPARKRIEVDFYFDIETADWDQFIVGGVLDATGFHAFWWDNDGERGMVEHILSLDGVGWGHNSGKFDVLLLLNHMVKRCKMHIFAAGSRLICVKMKDRELRDSAALAPMRLEDFSRIGGFPKIDTGLPCRCKAWPASWPLWARRGCGGYCSIDKNLTPEQRKNVERYLERDCKGGMFSLVALQKYADDHDLDLGSTVGGSAYRTAKRWAKIPDADWTPGGARRRTTESTLYKFARLGYFGGRTQCLMPRACRESVGYRDDINSAYPAALSKLSVPVGERVELFGAAAAAAFSQGLEGIYKARVEVPRMHIPPLPWKMKKRIAYPWGEFIGVWTGLELRYAVACGVAIHAITRAVVWKESAPLCKAFVDPIWALRDERLIIERAAKKLDPLAPKDALGMWLKWFANSFTGKTAQKPERESIQVNPEEKIKLCPGMGTCYGGCSGDCGRAYPIDADHRIWSSSVWRLSDCSHIEIAAYLTAATRIELHTHSISDGQEGRTTAYMDTDCNFSTEARTVNMGNGLGQWKREGLFWDFRCLAPKTYAFVDPETGEFVAKSKGIPMAEYNFEHLGGRFGGVLIDRGVDTFMTSVNRGGSLFKRKNLWRSVNADGLHFGDRLLGEDGLTHARDIQELLSDENR